MGGNGRESLRRRLFKTYLKNALFMIEASLKSAFTVGSVCYMVFCMRLLGSNPISPPQSAVVLFRCFRRGFEPTFVISSGLLLAIGALWVARDYNKKMAEAELKQKKTTDINDFRTNKITSWESPAQIGGAKVFCGGYDNWRCEAAVDKNTITCAVYSGGKIAMRFKYHRGFEVFMTPESFNAKSPGYESAVCLCAADWNKVEKLNLQKKDIYNRFDETVQMQEAIKKQLANQKQSMGAPSCGEQDSQERQLAKTLRIIHDRY